MSFADLLILLAALWGVLMAAATLAFICYAIACGLAGHDRKVTADRECAKFRAELEAYDRSES